MITWLKIRRPERVKAGVAPSVAVSPTAVGTLIPESRAGDFPSSRDLHLQALLHLPRFAEQDGTVDIKTATAEIDRLRAGRSIELAPLRALAIPPAPLPTLKQLQVLIVDRDAAEPILAHFHYLRSFREDSINVAALYQRQIVALCSLSPLDLPNIAQQLPIDSAKEVLVISRLFAFDWAPRNVVSFLLARAEHSEVVQANIRMLLTYVNPNMGFTGASYRAANWERIGTETGTRYAYLHGNYITDRQLADTSSMERWAVDFSRMPLKPLKLFGRFLDRRLALRSVAHGFVVERTVPPCRSAIARICS